jgi:hypothetical protein
VACHSTDRVGGFVASIVLRNSTGILRNGSGICCYDFLSSVNVAASGTPDWFVYFVSFGTRANNLSASSAVYSFPSTRVYYSGVTSVYHRSTLTLSLVSGVLTWTLNVNVTSSGSWYSNNGSVDWYGTKTGIDPKGTYNQSSVATTGPQSGTYPASASVS